MNDDYRNLGPPVGPEAEGFRADQFLARSFPFNSRSRWQALCWDARLLVNGRPVRPAHRLRCGDRLTVHHPLSEEPVVDDRIALLAESAGVIAVYKPGNLPMHESGHFRRRTFGALLATTFGPDWHPVHRLDRETSGIVICAATPALRRELSLAWEEGHVEKRYLAIVGGVPAWDRQLVDQPVALIPTISKPRYGVVPGGAPARTEFAVLARGAATALIAAHPRTGRTNQIRIHAAWMGHALIGEKVYHPDERVFASYCAEGDSPAVQCLAGFSRHALHAAAIRVRHPGGGGVFEVESPLPEDLAGLWAQLSEAKAGVIAGSTAAPRQPELAAWASPPT